MSDDRCKGYYHGWANCGTDRWGNSDFIPDHCGIKGKGNFYFVHITPYGWNFPDFRSADRIPGWKIHCDKSNRRNRLWWCGFHDGRTECDQPLSETKLWKTGCCDGTSQCNRKGSTRCQLKAAQRRNSWCGRTSWLRNDRTIQNRIWCTADDGWGNYHQWREKRLFLTTKSFKSRYRVCLRWPQAGGTGPDP